MFGLIGVPMGFLGFVDRGVAVVRAAVRPRVDRQSSAAAARRAADFHGHPARDDGTARRDHGAHLPRVAGQADLRDSRNARVPPARTDPAFIERLVVSVVLFSGGRGSDVLSRQLIGHPDVALTIAINGYDDGASTGEVRRFLGDSLGPSDFRKNASRVARETRSCPAGIIEVLDTRLPNPCSREDALQALGGYRGRGQAADAPANRRGPPRARIRPRRSSSPTARSATSCLPAATSTAAAASMTLSTTTARLLGLPAGLVENVSDGTNAFLVALERDRGVARQRGGDRRRESSRTASPTSF